MHLYSASLVFANTIYKKAGFKYFFSRTGSITSIEELMKYHGFDDVIDYKLEEDYKYDDNISEIGLGHRMVTYDGETKVILSVVIRGTNGTTKEWSSNVDLGDPDTEDAEWDENYHKGFYAF